MDKLISEEIQRMKLLSKYDNSTTLSEQEGSAELNMNRLNQQQLAQASNTSNSTKTDISQPKQSPSLWMEVLSTYASYYKITTIAGLPAIHLQFDGENDEVIFTRKRYFTYPKGFTKREPIQKGTWYIGRGDFGDRTLHRVPDPEVAPQTKEKKKNQSTKKVYTPSAQLRTPDEVKKFQDWLDTNAKGWATGYKDGIINKGQNGGGYGKFGPRTSKAWTTYGQQYLSSTSPQPIASKQAQELPVETNPPTQVNQDVNSL